MHFSEGLLKAMKDLEASREPDFFIGGKEDPYIKRYFLIPRNSYANVYLHRVVRSDDPRACHDHPFDNFSLVLENSYREVFADGSSVIRKAGDAVHRKAEQAHRLVVEGPPALTLFLTGPRVREWGFHCPKGWVPWTEFVTPGLNGESTIGRGCGEP